MWHAAFWRRLVVVPAYHTSKLAFIGARSGQHAWQRSEKRSQPLGYSRNWPRATSLSAAKGLPASALVGGMAEGYISRRAAAGRVSRVRRPSLQAVYASRARTSRKVTAISAAASTRKMPASMPWKAQNLPAGW